MLLGEPPRSAWDLNFSLFGIPVRIHPFFWLIVLLLGINEGKNFRVHFGVDQGEIIPLLIWIAAVFISILLHEFGHAMTLRAYGIRSWITLYGLGGAAAYDPAQARYGRGSGSRAQILVSLAGPGAGFLLATAISGVIVATGYKLSVLVGAPYGILVEPAEIIHSAKLTWFIDRLLFINILWGIVNLLPVYPLDGGQIAREILVAANPREGIQRSLWLSTFTGAGLAVVGLVLWKSVFVALLFGYLAYTSYATLQAYGRRGPW